MSLTLHLRASNGVTYDLVVSLPVVRDPRVRVAAVAAVPISRLYRWTSTGWVPAG